VLPVAHDVAGRDHADLLDTRLTSFRTPARIASSPRSGVQSRFGTQIGPA